MRVFGLLRTIMENHGAEALRRPSIAGGWGEGFESNKLYLFIISCCDIAAFSGYECDQTRIVQRNSRSPRTRQVISRTPDPSDPVPTTTHSAMAQPTAREGKHANMIAHIVESPRRLTFQCRMQAALKNVRPTVSHKVLRSDLPTKLTNCECLAGSKIPTARGVKARFRTSMKSSQPSRLPNLSEAF